MADLSLISYYRGTSRGRLVASCTYFQGDLLVAVGGYADERVAHVFNQSQGIKEFQVSDHSKALTCVGFSHYSVLQEPCFLCTASEDTIVLWDLTDTRTAYHKGEPCPRRILSSGQGYVNVMSFSSDSQFVAFGNWNEVVVFRVKTTELDTTLSGHDGNITGIEFYPNNPSHVVTIAEDRTFKIWDLKNSILLYQSAILSAWPLTCLTISSTSCDLIVGDSSGTLRMFAVDNRDQCECVCMCDTAKCVTKWLNDQSKTVSSGMTTPLDGPVCVSSRAKWKDPVPNSFEAGNVELGTGTSLMGLHLWRHSSNLNEEESDKRQEKTETFLPNGCPSGLHPIIDVLEEKETLVAATHHSLLFLNRKTLDLQDYRDLRDPIHQSSVAGVVQPTTVPLMCAVHFSSPLSATTPSTLWCVASALMESIVSVLEIKREGKRTALQGGSSTLYAGQPQTSTLSVLSSEPLSENSPLMAEMVVNSASSVKLKSHSYTSVSSVKTKKSVAGAGVVDKPLTFHSKIKSSGYATSSSRKLFTPNTGSPLRKSSSASLPKKNVSTSTSLSKGRYRKATVIVITSTCACTLFCSVQEYPDVLDLIILSIQEYPSDAPPATNLKHSFTITDRPSVINSLQYSSDGRCLVCACSDRSVQVLSGSLSTEKGRAYVGHVGMVNSASWSHSDQMFVSCSSDKTACVWALGQKEPILTFSHTKRNSKMQQKENSVTKIKGNLPYSHDVTSAQFYYLDKFILLSSGKLFFLYKYHFDLEKPDDVKRYQCSTRSILVSSFRSHSSQNITALSAANDFYSYIVLVGGSDKSVEVFDMNVGRGVMMLPNAQERPVHCIAQNKGSKFISHPSSGYDLFLTSAVTDGVKLWDLRQSKCVQHYVSHPNRVQPIQACFGPCAKYVATGAENRSVYIYDIRSNAPLHKLGCHSDAVTAVSYHPLYNQMVAGTSDGKLCQFINEQ